MDSIDKLTIETPEQIALEFPIAGLGSRSLAIVYDSLLLFIVFFVTTLALGFIAPGLSRIVPWSDVWLGAFFIILAFLAYWGYFAFFETVWKGQTPGKRHARIRVIKENGRPITAYEALARNLVRFVDQLPGMYAVGIVCMLISRQNKRLGDYVAGTVVVHESLGDARPALQSVALPAGTQLGVTNAARLSVHELELIETYLQRRYELSPQVRIETSRKILEHVKVKLGAGPEGDQGIDDFLESVARQVRTTGRFR